MLSTYSRQDPSVKVCDSIIGEVVQEFAGQLVRSLVEEMVLGHMAVIKAGNWLENFILETIEPMLPVVVRMFSRALKVILKDCLFVFLFVDRFVFVCFSVSVLFCFFVFFFNESKLDSKSSSLGLSPVWGVWGPCVVSLTERLVKFLRLP